MSKVTDKAKTLCLDGRVRITEEHDDYIRAWVEGASDEYRVEILPDGTERCQCPANELGHKRCSHIQAVRFELDGNGPLWRAERRAEERMRRYE